MTPTDLSTLAAALSRLAGRYEAFTATLAITDPTPEAATVFRAMTDIALAGDEEYASKKCGVDLAAVRGKVVGLMFKAIEEWE